MTTRLGLDDTWANRLASLLTSVIHGPGQARQEAHAKIMDLGRQVDIIRAQGASLGERKARERIKEEGYERHGTVIRKGDELVLITDLGRAEMFTVNEHGGIKLPEIVEIERERATEDEIKSAREQFANDELNVDDDAAVSYADDVVWVQAWVRITSAEDIEKRRLFLMHDDHYGSIADGLYKKRITVHDYEVIDDGVDYGVSYWLLFMKKTGELHYYYAERDFACHFTEITEVGKPYQYWFLQALEKKKNAKPV